MTKANRPMALTLYSYPQLYGQSDNNPYGLKVATFMKLCNVEFRQAHIVDTTNAPRGQLPYLDDDGVVIGDSDDIIEHLTVKFDLTIDRGLTDEQRRTDLMIRRMLDDLYWVMSYSRWADERFWPSFRDELLRTHGDLRPDQLEAARTYNFQRYHYQGIGRYEPAAAYKRGVRDLQALAGLLGDGPFVFGDQVHAADATVHGFVANIYFYDIDTPLKQAVLAAPNLVEHCLAVRTLASQG
ncbi:MAG TPA: glutathione S-transferase family protein [Geminicoccus sp.]|uniref:glutathione S-transferase family protein n=1 Tax=Geminicoccus sp. TaxID=2024832 RepID=UPI002E34E10B|nr:glutathione S-transferase family protein [Geminicoccus sp.]HEX2526196.1 glutathione S-transferase family protein [Geminicoccus sp.]